MALSEKIKAAFASNKLATISTVDESSMSPESALIAFVEGNELELYFQTSNRTRKYKNIQRNNKVAIVIGFDMLTIQYEGFAEQIIDRLMIDKVKQMFADKESPSTRYYLDLPDAAIFKVTPTWIGYRDYIGNPPHIENLDLA